MAGHLLAPAYLATDRGLLRIAETSHSSGILWCHVVDAPTYEDYADQLDEASPNLGVLELGFDLLGLGVSDFAVRGLRCVYGVGGEYLSDVPATIRTWTRQRSIG